MTDKNVETRKITPEVVNRDPPYTSIGIEDLFGLLLNIKGATFAQLFSTTEPKMRKTNNPFFGNVLKDSIINTMLGFEYENVVNNARVRDAIALAEEAGVDKETLETLMRVFNRTVSEFVEHFTPKPRQWGSHVIDGSGKRNRILVEHTNKQNEYNRYVQVWVLATKPPVYRWKSSGEVINDITVAAIKEFFPRKHSNAEHQGVEQEIVIRDYLLENVKRIHLNRKRLAIQ